MSKKMTDDEIRELAARRVRRRRGFYSHLVAYILVNLMLVAIWYFTGRSYFWPVWVMLFWGIGLVFNGVAVFAKGDIGSERAAIEKEIAKIKKSGF
ncbi:MAG: 2TM domain-containing protein [Dehalococcoidia bacterium]|nr:2TM domain-containing protein [Dehalococcoidia bacterium]